MMVGNVRLVTQQENDGCLIACCAMVAGCRYEDVPATARESFSNAVAWLESQGLDVVALKTNTMPRQGRLYLVCAPSLNIMSTLHEMVMDCTTEPNRLLDPRDGCGGDIKVYTLADLYRRNQWRLEYEIRRRS